MKETASPQPCPEDPCVRLSLLLEENALLLKALGGKTHQHLLLQMIRQHGGSGKRIGEIARISSLFRAAASTHVQILREAGLL